MFGISMEMYEVNFLLLAIEMTLRILCLSKVNKINVDLSIYYYLVPNIPKWIELEV